MCLPPNGGGRHSAGPRPLVHGPEGERADRCGFLGAPGSTGPGGPERGDAAAFAGGRDTVTTASGDSEHGIDTGEVEESAAPENAWGTVFIAWRWPSPDFGARKVARV